MLRRSRWAARGTIALTCVLAVACGESKPEMVASASASASAGPKGMTNKLAKAVHAAESAGAVGSASPGAQPPPKGIFAPGDADRLFAANAAPIVTLLDEGAEPRLALKRKAPTQEQKLPLHLSLSTAEQGGQGLGWKPTFPALALVLAIGPEKSASEDKGDEKAGDKEKRPAKPSASASASAAPRAPEPPLTATGPRITARVTEAGVEGGNEHAPKDVADVVAKLKGATIAFTLTDGGLADMRKTVPPGAEKLDIALRAAEEALSSFYMPAPEKPVGEGGYFMVTDRRLSLGVEVVRYRVFKVVKVDGDVASLSLDQKQYAVSPKIDLPEAGDQLSKVLLTEYHGSGAGILDVAPNLLFAKGAAMRLETPAGVSVDKARGLFGFQLQALMGDVPAGVKVEQGAQGGGDELPGPN